MVVVCGQLGKVYLVSANLNCSILSTITFVFVYVSVFSQKGISFGTKLGGSISNLTYMDGTSTPLVGVVGGFYFRFNFNKNRKLKLSNHFYIPILHSLIEG